MLVTTTETLEINRHISRLTFFSDVLFQFI